METTLMIKCDIKHAPAILLAASNIITKDKEEREHRLKTELKEVQAVVSLDVHQWMKLTAIEKQKHINRDSYGNEFDIAMFNRENYGMTCELCTNEQQAEVPFVVGTSDTREPKYCFQHYQLINENSRFIKKGVS